MVGSNKGPWGCFEDTTRYLWIERGERERVYVGRRKEDKSSLVKIVPESIRLQLVYGQLGFASHGSPILTSSPPPFNQSHSSRRSTNGGQERQLSHCYRTREHSSVQATSSPSYFQHGSSLNDPLCNSKPADSLSINLHTTNQGTPQKSG